MAGLGQGDVAPEFELPRDGGGSISLAALRGKPIVLFFYPKDDTKACTEEAISFSALAKEFQEAGIALVGISPDSAKSHDRFTKKHGLTVALGADEDKAAANAYGVWVEKSMYGRKYMGVERTTFLIDRQGVISRVWEKVKVPGHADEVLAAAKTL
ncbi:peroxiredoxin [Sinorhizobium meliloti WSM1022]|jgi:thioredoxin-dependent peroxiredoxin|uniref:thioredoxin-dependent peroxiredoxin n=2 Tax=Sinorhizobium TaxID=28105 RepID=H0G3J5_RHIML|nr:MULTISPECIES: peroxiredoxin [Sinorhizobium]ASQ03956.1 peroxiredoxin [Sinorhizobium meliloti]EHK76155.1 alkyl hydroperoxide reductase/ thiol specific antioxidant/ Mal allergen [Sinorhizobium meliloti CCNWSX0020]MCO6424613.1 peroxiredoxin [Sinorhizobium meliloti]MDW9357645.1 redoxin domain-containing protein [Sinorhizobium meliloti]MDW9409454.1 redoxin domain-containing protein [Sinorhizobium meliloti]